MFADWSRFGDIAFPSNCKSFAASDSFVSWLALAKLQRLALKLLVRIMHHLLLRSKLHKLVNYSNQITF